MPGNYTHVFLMKHFKAQGRELTLSGICAGFAEAARIFFLMGVKEYQRFIEIVDYIANHNPDYLAIKALSIREPLLESKYSYPLPSSNDVSMMNDIIRLFDTISIFTQPQIHYKEIGRVITQPKVMEVTRHIESKLFDSYVRSSGGTCKISSFPIIFDNKDDVSRHYLAFLQELAATAATAPACSVSVCLDSLSHRTHLGFDGTKQQWYLSDVNQLAMLAKPVESRELGNVIIDIMNLKSHKGAVALDTAIYSSKVNSARFITACKQAVQRHNTIFNLESAVLVRVSGQPQKFNSKKSCDGVTYAHLAAKFGYSSLMKKIKSVHSPAINEISADLFTPHMIAEAMDQYEVLNVLKAPDIKLHKPVKDWKKLYEEYKKNKTYPLILHDILKQESDTDLRKTILLKFIYVAITIGDINSFCFLMEQYSFNQTSLQQIMKNILAQYNSRAEFEYDGMVDVRYNMLQYLLQHGLDLKSDTMNKHLALREVISTVQPPVVKLFLDHALDPRVSIRANHAEEYMRSLNIALDRNASLFSLKVIARMLNEKIAFLNEQDKRTSCIDYDHRVDDITEKLKHLHIK